MSYVGFVRNKFTEAPEVLLTDNGTEHDRTVPYSPQQNGSAEQINRHLLEVER